jgi:hypothetical protein
VSLWNETLERPFSIVRVCEMGDFGPHRIRTPEEGQHGPRCLER